MSNPEQCGSPSLIFGPKFPYPFSGKQVLFELLKEFAAEYNKGGKAYLETTYGAARAKNWCDLRVTSAYPTTKQDCPSISVILMSESAPQMYMAQEIESVSFKSDMGAIEFQQVRGETCTDELEITISTLVEAQRDDLFVYLKQWLLDAIAWALPQLRDGGGVYDIRRVNAADDVIEYAGSAAQPGFQFYAARMMYTVTYDLIVLKNVDQVLSTFNWDAHLGNI
jgi:hypothetical protein